MDTGQQKLEQFTFSEIYASTIHKHLYVELGTSVTVLHVVKVGREQSWGAHGHLRSRCMQTNKKKPQNLPE
jgi:hypothetical protein